MKKFYSLLLSMLLLAVGGVEVEAQTLIKSWDFTTVNTTEAPGNTTDYVDYTDENLRRLGVTIVDNSDGSGNYNLAFKGSTEIHNAGSSSSFLIVDSRTTSDATEAGVRIPASQGYIVKVTGYAESAINPFIWIGAEIDSDMGSKEFGNNTTTTVYGVAISGQVCSDDIKKHVAIENDKVQANRSLRIYKIEVYKPNTDFKFQLVGDYDTNNYTVYTEGDVLKGYVFKGTDHTPLNVTLAGVPGNANDRETTIPLTKDMFKEWDGCGSSANVKNENIGCSYEVGTGNSLSQYGTFYGDGDVNENKYADISRADAIRIEGTPGLYVRVVFNRNNDGSYIEDGVALGNDGTGKIELSAYDYVHLNAIKNWGTTEGSITSLTLVSQGVNYSYDIKGDIEEVEFEKSTGKVNRISGDGGAVVVRSTYTDFDTGIISNDEYVITVPYETHEWDFGTIETQSNLYKNTSSISDWGLTWKVRKYLGDNENNEMTQLSAPVLSNTEPIKGDNARFIDATAGLIFESGTYSFGTNVNITPDKEIFDYDASPANRAKARDTYNSANNVKDDPNNAVTMQVGSKLIIPNLLPGQHIRIRWNRHNPNIGELMRAFNVTDLEGTSMTEMLFNVGAGSVSTKVGHQEFIVEADKDNPDKRVDVTFELLTDGKYTQPGFGEVEVGGIDPTDPEKKRKLPSQQGWVNILNIKIGPAPKDDPNFYFDTHMRPIEGNVSGHTRKQVFADTNGKEYISKEYTDYVRDAIHTYLRKKTDELTVEYDTNKGKVHTQSGGQVDTYHVWGDGTNTTEPTDEKLRFTGTLNADNCKIENNKLTVAPNAHGTFTLVLESRQALTTESNSYCVKEFLLDSAHVNVKIYEYDYNEKPYPYTWAMEHFTGDTGNASLDEIKKDIALAQNGDSHFWDAGNVFNVGHPENMIALKVKTSGTGEAKTVQCPLNSGNINDNGTTVATLTLGTSGVNGNYKDGFSYTIVPKYNGTVTLTANVEANKKLYIREYSDNEQRNDVLIYISGILLDNNGNPIEQELTHTFDVRKDRHYRIYSHESSALTLSNLSYTYYPNGGDEYYIPEFDGLGFFPMEYWDEKDKNVQLDSDDKGIMLSGNKTYQLIVPNVKLGETVYLAVSDDQEGSIAVGTPEATIERAKDRSGLVNMTGKIGNADFEQNTYKVGWPARGTMDPWIWDGGFNGPTILDGINGKSCEFWNGTAADLSFYLHQTLSDLPAGKYELRAKAGNSLDGQELTDAPGRAILYAQINGYAPISTPVEISGVSQGEMVAKTYSVLFNLNGGESVELGFKTDGIMAARWFICDDVELWYYGKDDNTLPNRIGHVYKDAENYEAKGHYDTKELSIYEIEGQKKAGEDVLIYLKNVNLHKVAVSVDNKNVSAAGYATEAREYPLDFTLANLFLGREQIAYQVTGVKNTDSEKPNVDISEVRYIPRTEDKDPAKNNGVMITGDYINRTSATTWPLFTTDVDRKMSNMESNRLVGVVNSANIENVTQRTRRTDVANDYWYNYLLSLAGYVVKYGDDDTVDGDGYHNTKGEAIEEVKGLGFYLVMEDGTKLPGNQGNYTAGKPQNHSAYLQLEERLAKQNEFNQSGNYLAGARQVFFIDVDSILTGIDEVQIDDDELSATEENNSANILKNGVFYTLQGVPVKNPTKGIYIFNGKKVYVK